MSLAMWNILRRSLCARTDDACNEYNVNCIAKGVVEHVVCTAEQLLASDPERCFLYKRPTAAPAPPKLKFAGYDSSTTESTSTSTSEESQQQKLGSYPNAHPESTESDSSKSTESSSDDISVTTERRMHDSFDWPIIDDFQFGDASAAIRDFISLWRLSPATLCELIVPSHSEEDVPPLGERYYIDAHFSKPTNMCPNPLAIAKVHFAVHVSHILPKDYPIMVTYKFEGCRQRFYALGDRCIRSLRFQRLYIDTILDTKLAFYAEVVELRHPRFSDYDSNIPPHMGHKASMRSRLTQVRQRSFGAASMDSDMPWARGPWGYSLGGDYD